MVHLRREKEYNKSPKVQENRQEFVLKLPIVVGCTNALTSSIVTVTFQHGLSMKDGKKHPLGNLVTKNLWSPTLRFNIKD